MAGPPTSGSRARCPSSGGAMLCDPGEPLGYQNPEQLGLLVR